MTNGANLEDNGSQGGANMLKNWLKGAGILTLLVYMIHIINQQKSVLEASKHNEVNMATIIATAGLSAIVWLVRREKIAKKDKEADK